MDPAKPEPAPPAPAAAAPRRDSRWIALLGLLVVGGSAVGALIYQGLQAKPEKTLDRSGFDIAQVAAPSRTAPSSSAPARPASSPFPLLGGAELGTAPGRPAAAPAPSGASAAAGVNEQQFVEKYAGVIARYQARLLPIADRYYRENATVRRIDAEFAGMARFQSLKQQYIQDKKPFSFVRGAVALPEVRAAISKNLADPEAWKASFGMLEEGLKAVKKEPPPADMYKSGVEFMANDPAMSAYVGTFIKDVTNNVPALIQGIPPGADTSALTPLINDFAPSAHLGGAPAAPAPAKR